MYHKTAVHAAELALLLLLAAALAYATALENQQQGISDEMIRLHVVANSDSEADQTVKLQVRDAVLREAEEIMEPAACQSDAKALLRQNLGRIETAANDVLTQQGSGDKASVTLSRELFGTRTYDTFALPGGYYDALRVSIGNAEGRNWWCVVYPQICTAATTEEQRSVAVMGGLSDEQVSIIEEDTPEYQFKFKMIELVEDLLGWFRASDTGIPVSR